MLKRRRGGVNQRLSALQAAKPDSALVAFLGEAFAWGDLSPQLTAKIARLACVDIDNATSGNLDDTLLRNMAALGSGGAHPENMSRGLLALLPSSKIPSPHVLPVEYRIRSGLGLPQDPCSIIGLRVAGIFSRLPFHGCSRP